jgi:septum formation protein
MMAVAFSISRRHAAFSVVTRRTLPWSETVVTLASAGPTTCRHANSTFSGVNGAWRSTNSTEAGTSWETGIMAAAVVYGMPLPRVVLASASPRRAELLTAAGLPFDVAPADVDESRWPGEAPESYCERVARAKALAVAARAPGRVVLAADTIVVVDAEVFGKPVDGPDARRMLLALSGRIHEVLTAVAIAAAGGVRTVVERTTVEFVPLAEADIAWYVDTGEPMDKAGAYAIQGLASRFVARIQGSYSNVVGLPVATVYRLLGDIDPR